MPVSQGAAAGHAQTQARPEGRGNPTSGTSVSSLPFLRSFPADKNSWPEVIEVDGTLKVGRGAGCSSGSSLTHNTGQCLVRCPQLPSTELEQAPSRFTVPQHRASQHNQVGVSPRGVLTRAKGSRPALFFRVLMRAAAHTQIPPSTPYSTLTKIWHRGIAQHLAATQDQHHEAAPQLLLPLAAPNPPGGAIPPRQGP